MCITTISHNMCLLRLGPTVCATTSIDGNKALSWSQSGPEDYILLKKIYDPGTKLYIQYDKTTSINAFQYESKDRCYDPMAKHLVSCYSPARFYSPGPGPDMRNPSQFSPLP